MIRYSKVRSVKSPCRGSRYSAGIDFFVPNDFNPTVILPGEDILIPSGIKMEIPEHCMLIAVDKSGVASSDIAKERCGMKYKPSMLCSAIMLGAKLVDADYPGEIHLHLINVGKKSIVIEPGQKVAQFVLMPVFYDNPIEVPEAELRIPETERIGGFGSTNK